MTHDGEIRRTKEGYELTFTRELRHPPERVWAMLTDPARIGEWYVRSEIEPRVGGRAVEYHEHAGEASVSHGTVTRFEPPRVFEHTWWDDEYAQKGLANVIRWELHPTRAGTRLVLTHRFPDLEGAHGVLAGWDTFLTVLASVLDGAPRGTHAVPKGELREGAFVETSPGRGAWKDRAALEARYRERVEALARHAGEGDGGAITGTFAMTVHVRELPRAADFWRGMGLAVEQQDAAVRVRVPGSGPLVLHAWDSACASNGGRPPGTVTGLQLAVDDAAAACARVERAGGRVVAAPFPAPGGGTWAVIADPDGNELMLCAPA